MLAPLGRAYGALARGRRRLYDAAKLATQPPIPVVSVGALTVGGSGKTPIARHLAEVLSPMRVGVVTRGRAGLVQHGPLAGVRHGDEAALLARWLPRAVVFAERDKHAAATRCYEAGSEVVVVDDGFQHLRLSRQLDILILEDHVHPLPAGRGRELAPGSWPPRLLRWRHGRDGLVPDGDADVCSVCEATELQRIDGRALDAPSALAGCRVELACGIARPTAFEALVRRLGARVVARHFVRDHAPLRLPRERTASDAVLCTEKDAARMHGVAGYEHVVVLACRVRVVRGQATLAARLRALGLRTGPC